ncbi:hypothetical protein CDCA_CDCA13G3617 [Cyanidium caldarium]|uniref:UvrABC system protein B n=1 Tax=Cyanidium caldarium TaxID=2771 RepID=A0AAV9IZ58_CYACA|nr:hypothetical protein CDCA_CDCA13G3617 [Cyanidium caldarium]
MVTSSARSTARRKRGSAKEVVGVDGLLLPPEDAALRRCIEAVCAGTAVPSGAPVRSVKASRSMRWYAQSDGAALVVAVARRSAFRERDAERLLSLLETGRGERSVAVLLFGARMHPTARKRLEEARVVVHEYPECAGFPETSVWGRVPPPEPESCTDARLRAHFDSMPPAAFQLQAPFAPTGDQPEAIEQVVQSLTDRRFVALKGATGTGKTFVMANVIARTGRPTLVLAHNKTLAAQLFRELRTFFPDNAVQYFVSYYDYYLPEAYVSVTDTYIEKSASINEDIERYRHAATRALFERRDVIVVASISCIYGLGLPSEYLRAAKRIAVGDALTPTALARVLVQLQYVRNDVELERGSFRVRGDTVDIAPPAWDEEDALLRVEFFGGSVESVAYIDRLQATVLRRVDQVLTYPARHFLTPPEEHERALQAIEREMQHCVSRFRTQGKHLEAERLEQRSRNDLEMLREFGYCTGVENYSLHLSGRSPTEPPDCLLDYFPPDWLLIVDESHVTVPQIRGMYFGDRSRKENLVRFGFRLPSALENRPLRETEFWRKVRHCLFVSATPGPMELELAAPALVEQTIRPTGVLDPLVRVHPTRGQVEHLLQEIEARVQRGEKALVTTLTKRMAEELCTYLRERRVRVSYLHSELDALERVQVLSALATEACDAIVGVNLLREGLDLPQVSLVAIMDADKEGFLRSETSLIQTIGRAARHVRGEVVLYADTVTASMQRALQETERRRAIQEAYNARHGITPRPIERRTGAYLERRQTHAAAATKSRHPRAETEPTWSRLSDDALQAAMRAAATRLEFEDAAAIRDLLKRRREGDRSPE